MYIYLKEANSARARSLSRIVDCIPAFYLYIYLHIYKHLMHCIITYICTYMYIYIYVCVCT